MLQSEVIKKLDEITSKNNFIYIICLFILKDFVGSINDIGKVDPYDRLNYNEASFLIGLWIKNSKKSNNEELDYMSTIDEVYSLMEVLHMTFLSESVSPIDKSFSRSDFMINGNRFKEAFFYGSTGAYEFQYINKSVEKYRRDDKWLIDNKGFSINSVVEYFKNIKSIISKKLSNRHIFYDGTVVEKEGLRSLLCFSQNELNEGNVEFEAITLSFTSELEKGFAHELNAVGDYNEFQTKPIVKLESGDFFIPMPYYLAEAIYESPFYWMNEDKAYKARSLENRGSVAEEIVFKHFSKIFGETNTYRGVKIAVNSTLTKSDIDVVGLFDDIAIVVQIKSKKLTALSKQGNIEKIKDDFEKAVESAFLQGEVCKECIEDAANYRFILSDGDVITNRFLRVKSTYIICVVLDFYPAIAHLTQALLYDKYDKSTICFSVFDLETICKFLATPAKLVDYFIKRINNCRFYHADNELCYLGFYLENDLVEHEGFTDAIIDSDYGAKIDRMYYADLLKGSEKVPSKKIGRNEKCPCGSGKKFKNCHGKTK